MCKPCSACSLTQGACHCFYYVITAHFMRRPIWCRKKDPSTVCLTVCAQRRQTRATILPIIWRILTTTSRLCPVTQVIRSWFKIFAIALTCSRRSSYRAVLCRSSHWYPCLLQCLFVSRRVCIPRICTVSLIWVNFPTRITHRFASNSAKLQLRTPCSGYSCTF